METIANFLVGEFYPYLLLAFHLYTMGIHSVHRGYVCHVVFTPTTSHLKSNVPLSKNHTYEHDAHPIPIISLRHVELSTW